MTTRLRNPLVSLLAILVLVLIGARVMTSAFGPSVASAADSTVTPPAGAETTPPPQATTTPDATTTPATTAPDATTAPGVAAAPAPAPAPAPPDSEQAVPDGGWPRSLITPTGAVIILYQPQILTWQDQKQLTAMAALSYATKETPKPELGTLKLVSPTSVSMSDRLVNLTSIQLSEIRFASLGRSQTQEAIAEIEKSLPTQPVVIGLDRVLAAVDKSQITTKGAKIQTKAPPIFYSTRPAILIMTDGDMIMSPISGTTLKYVVNTNWDLIQDQVTKTFYLRNEKNWFQSPDGIKDWKPVDKLPDSFKQIPNDDNWREARENIPGKGISMSKMPTIYTSNQPSELIVLEGKPKFKKIKDTKLEYATNTESQLFHMKEKKGNYYYLISGRWFSSENPEGPWAFATPNLPPDFQNIPIDHAKAEVRASVPGTDEAAEAVLLASIPQTARVNAKEIKAPDVTYDGEPEFKTIQGSPVLYAANSSYDVVRVESHYYLCYQAVWFVSTSPKGPWTLCTSIPVEIANLPSDAPVQHLAYVTVVDPNAEYPVYAYTAGYTGVSVAFGCAMWGTGWYYPPYYHGGYYHPWPPSYGGGYRYNPHTGAYGRYATAYGPYGGVAGGASYNPRTGTYKRGAAAYGPSGGAHAGQAYNPRTGTAASTRGGSNVYGSWGSTTVARGDDWARTQRVTDANGNTRWKGQGSGGGSASGWRGPGGSGFVGEKNGDVYAGRNGDVYRKTDGGWQSYDNGGWNDVGGSGNRPGQQPSAGTRPSQQPSAGTRPSQQPSAGTRPTQQPSAGTRPTQQPGNMDQLNRDAQARQQGNQRTQSSQSSRGGSSSGSRGGGSRGGGGRGGGGRR